MPPRPVVARQCIVCGEPYFSVSLGTLTHPGRCAGIRRAATNSQTPLEVYIARLAVREAPYVPRIANAPSPLVAPVHGNGLDHGSVNTLCPPVQSVGNRRQIGAKCQQKPTAPVQPMGAKRTVKESLQVRPRTHLIIPDCQVHDGVPTEHLEWIGRYIADKRPDVIIQIGDFADLPSLCSYDKGKKRAEGQRYVNDIEAARAAMERLVAPFRDIPGYRPRMVLTLGNHEDRITRAVEDFAVLEHSIGIHDLAYESFGWEVHPFLEVVEIDGVEYSHYFTSGAMGRPVTSAAALLRVRQGSAIMGHVQQTECAFHPKTQKIAIFCGTCYEHSEDYLGFQGNVQRRQIVVLHEVEDGRFDPLFVSLGYLRRRYAA